MYHNKSKCQIYKSKKVEEPFFVIGFFRLNLRNLCVIYKITYFIYNQIIMAKMPAIIYRPFLGLEVKQNIDDMFYNATDVLKVYNSKEEKEKRMDVYINMDSTKDFINQLEEEDVLKHVWDVNKNKEFSPIKTKRGKYWGTRMHSKLLLDFMMWISPEFKSKAYDFILNGFSLAGKRNELKEWYKKMSKAIAESGNANYREEATMINVLCTWSCANNQRSRLNIDKMKQMEDMQTTNASLIKAGLSIEERKNILAKTL